MARSFYHRRIIHTHLINIATAAAHYLQIRYCAIGKSASGKVPGIHSICFPCGIPFSCPVICLGLFHCSPLIQAWCFFCVSLLRFQESALFWELTLSGSKRLIHCDFVVTEPVDNFCHVYSVGGCSYNYYYCLEICVVLLGVTVIIAVISVVAE